MGEKVAAKRGRAGCFVLNIPPKAEYKGVGSGGARFFSGHPLSHLLGVAARITQEVKIPLEYIGEFPHRHDWATPIQLFLAQNHMFATYQHHEANHCPVGG